MLNKNKKGPRAAFYPLKLLSAYMSSGRKHCSWNKARACSRASPLLLVAPLLSMHWAAVLRFSPRGVVFMKLKRARAPAYTVPRARAHTNTRERWTKASAEKTSLTTGFTSTACAQRTSTRLPTEYPPSYTRAHARAHTHLPSASVDLRKNKIKAQRRCSQEEKKSAWEPDTERVCVYVRERASTRQSSAQNVASLPHRVLEWRAAPVRPKELQLPH